MGQKGDQNQEDQGVLDQSSNSELNSTVGSCSLRGELANISVMLSKLKTYSPERKNTRLGKGQLLQVDCLSKIIEYLDNIHQLNTKLVSKVDELAEENSLLKQQIDSLQESHSSYAAVTATRASSSNAERPVSSQSAINPAPQDLKIMTTKIDQLEQETLSNVIMLQGPAVECIVSNNSERAPTNGSTDGSHRHSKFAHLKTAVFECLRTAAVPIQMDHITAVWPQGRDRKHLKIGACAIAAALASGGPRAPCGTPPPAANYTNEQYLGHWYEMGRVQTIGGALFQVGCMCSVSDFETEKLVQGDGNITYTCRKYSTDAELTSASAELVYTGTPGIYYQVYPYPNATMLNYYVIYIDEDSAMEYDCGTNDRGLTNYCVHILSRTPDMDPTKLQTLLDYAELLGLNSNGIEYNPISHEGCW